MKATTVKYFKDSRVDKGRLISLFNDLKCWGLDLNLGEIIIVSKLNKFCRTQSAKLDR
jgi:hypothetical protein